MKYEYRRLLLSFVRKISKIQAAHNKWVNRPLNGKRLPLGFRRFRRQIRPWPQERAQMSQLLRWHEEEGLSIERCYFKALKHRMKNLRIGAEICKERIRQMINAERRLREEAAREVAAELVRLADQGNSVFQILNAASRKKLIDIDEITVDEIHAIIETERQLQIQEREQSDATQQ